MSASEYSPISIHRDGKGGWVQDQQACLDQQISKDEFRRRNAERYRKFSSRPMALDSGAFTDSADLQQAFLFYKQRNEERRRMKKWAAFEGIQVFASIAFAGLMFWSGQPGFALVWLAVAGTEVLRFVEHIQRIQRWDRENA